MALAQARIPSREALSRAFVRLRHAGTLFRSDGLASFRADGSLLADLLLRGGILITIADPAGTPAARILIQPDADVLMSVDRRRLSDPALMTKLQEEQRAISARLASASRPLDAMWIVTHAAAAIAYVSIAGKTAANLGHWLAQAAAAAAITLFGMCGAAVLRRVALRWLLRRL